LALKTARLHVPSNSRRLRDDGFREIAQIRRPR
jgi:hypothetical protein